MSASDGKWLESLSPDVSVGRAARVALAARLDAVREALAPAAELSEDPEPIHELRVATRRAAAVIDVFDSRLPRKAARRARKALRKLRRSAAAAREADVFLAALDGWAPGRPNVEKPGIHFFFGQVTTERRAAQARVRAAIRECDSRWAFRLERCLTTVRRGGRPLGEHAPPICVSLVHELDTAVSAADLDDAERLHAMRIAGKHLRYAFELLAPALAPDAPAALYPILSELQGILGVAHDNLLAIRRCDSLIDDLTALRPHQLPTVRAGISAIRSAQREQFAAQKAAFAAWRSRWPAVRKINFSV